MKDINENSSPLMYAKIGCEAKKNNDNKDTHMDGCTDLQLGVSIMTILMCVVEDLRQTGKLQVLYCKMNGRVV